MTKILKKTKLIPFNYEGVPFVAGFLIIGILLLFLFPPLGQIAILLAIGSIYFFRDPPRVPPLRDLTIAAAADGEIIAIKELCPPLALGLSQDYCWCISIRSSLFDVHVSRIPIDCKLEAVIYQASALIDAMYIAEEFDDQENIESIAEGEQNEYCAIRMMLNDGRDMAVVQMTSVLATKFSTMLKGRNILKSDELFGISCNVKEGEDMAIGERLGILHIGNRVDIYLPQGSLPTVLVGQKAISGETVIAQLT